MTAWISIFIPIAATLLLLIFFKKKVVLWETALLLAPSALLILLLNFIMVSSNESDTEYLGGYIDKVMNYDPWDEEVPCSHPVYCTGYRTDDKGNTTTYQYECGHQHAYDVDYHPRRWTKVTNSGDEMGISEYVYEVLRKQFHSNTYFVEMRRDFHSIDGDAHGADWDKLPEHAEIITLERSYVNKVRASHSIFKFEHIDEKAKARWHLYDYPKVSESGSYYQPCVLGKKITSDIDRKFQYLNGWYGPAKQFRMYIMYFTNQSMDVAFKQRSYLEGGNKNEFIVCIGTDSLGNYRWNKCFSWMDKPELEVITQGWLNDQGLKNKSIDLAAFADWMPKQIEQHWHRKRFRDFAYLNVELSGTQLIWILIIVFIYNVGISVWIVVNEFTNEEKKIKYGFGRY
ncbi:MAG: hypothetical protein V4658_08510 [Bacteroidota bacterium]